MKRIARTWRGYTRPENASTFENFLKQTVFPEFQKELTGYEGVQLLKRELNDEVEFTTIMWFDSIDSIKSFAGEDYETAHIDPNVQKLLSNYDRNSTHSEVSFSSI